MLISLNEILKYLKPHGITINGIIHIGAHLCEERNDYHNHGISDEKTIWIEANPEVIKNIPRGIKNIFNYVVSDKDDNEVTFHVTNNGQSSSILELHEHKKSHPDVVEISSFTAKTKTLNTIFNENNLDKTLYNMMNLDIQGAELLALKGASDILPNIKIIYTEVNKKELYKGCALLDDIDLFLKSQGFNRVAIKMYEHWGWGDALYLRT